MSVSSAKVKLVLLLFVAFPTIITCIIKTEGTSRKLETNGNSKIDFKVAYYKQKVDHFGFSNQDFYQQRYLIADQFWNGKGPIFFYAGNEGDITWFCNNTGLMWDWGPEFNALLVFAEHRYYGDSMPYGTDSYIDLAHLGYLTTEQALADFVTLLESIKKNTPDADDKPVVAFGGSYGGMLAAWLRMKYPHVVVGSLASSAPVWQFGDLVECGSLYQIVTNDFKNAGANCDTNIRKSWDVINDMGASDTGRRFMQDAFHLCKPLTSDADVGLLKAWLSETWGNLAMVDYPYPANFLEPLPAWPIKEVCKFLSSSSLSDHQLINQLYKSVNLYFNYTGGADCFSTTQQATANLGDLGWGFQACTEMVMPMCTDGVKDMFEPSEWDIKAFSDNCKKQWWGVETRPHWAIDEYGGKDIKASSNIIFSNGLLDPWSGGGVTETLAPSLISIIIPEGAHHLDLRSSNPDDPPSVIRAREQEKSIIQGWIKQYYDKSSNLQAEAPASHSEFRLLGSQPEATKERPVGAIAMSIFMTVMLLCGAAFAIYLAVGSPRKKTRANNRSQPDKTAAMKCPNTERQPLLYS